MSKPLRKPKPKPKPKSLNDPRHTAVHEAGHAAIGRVLALVCGGVSTEPDFETGEAGSAIIADHFACTYAWEKRGKVRTDDAALHGRIIAYMAGAESEVVILGLTQGGDGNDRCQIELMAEELTTGSDWKRLEPRLRAMTSTLIRRHRALIERVADVLLAKGKLTAKQLDKLVGRSVNDVKVNAPTLLMMSGAAR
jgi:hypothetical protein